MAGQGEYKRNAVTYYFEGDTIDLEHSMDRISKLMSDSIKTFEKYQKEGLTATQKKQVESVEHLQAILQAAWDAGKKLTGEQVAHLKRTGREAFSIVKQMQNEALRLQEKYDKEQQKKADEKAKAAAQRAATRKQLNEPSSQLMASQRAAYLSGALQDPRLQGALTEPATKEITSALEAYQKVLDGTVKRSDSVAKATAQLNEVYNRYSRTLKSIVETEKRREVEAKKAAAEERKATEDELKQILMMQKAYKEAFHYSSTAGQEQARQNASFLKSMSDELRSFISQDAYTEIQRAADHFNAIQKAFKEGQITEGDLINETIKLNDVYKQYADTLRTVRQSFLAANKSIKSFGDALDKLKSYLTVQIQSVTFWIRVLRQAVQMIRQGIQYAADYVESINFLNVAVGESIEQFTEFTRLQRLALGLDPTELNETVATFFAFGNAIGFSHDNAVKASQGLTQLASDMASLYNTDLTTMMTSIKSGMAGNTRAMMKYGISVHDTTIEEWLLQKGLTKSMDKMSEASQAMARYAFIIEKTSMAQGDLARTIESPANQMRILTTQGKLLIQNLGAIALVIVGPLLRAINMVLQPINAFLTALTAVSMSGISGAISEQADDLDDLAESADDAVAGLSGLDEINQMSTNKKVTAVIDTDIQELFDAAQYNNLVDKIQPLIDAFDRLGQALAPLFASLGEPFSIAISSLSKIFDLAGGILGIFTPLFNLVDWFAKSVLGPVNTWLEYLTTHLELTIPLLASIIALLAVSHWDAFVGIVSKMAMGFVNLGKSILSAISSLVKWIAQQAIAIAQGIKNAIVAWIQEKAYWKLAVAIIAAAGIAAVGVLAVVGAATAGASAMADANQSSKPTGLATGGVVTGPTFALVGEGKYDEAVIPLGNSPQMAEMQRGIAERVVQTSQSSGSTGAIGGGNATVQLNIDGRSLGRASINNINKVRRQVGVDIK